MILAAGIPTLSGMQITVTMMKLTAAIGDGRSSAQCISSKKDSRTSHRNQGSHDNTIDRVITIVSEQRERFMFIGPLYSVPAGRS
jgi:hypothetical protein